MMRKYEVEEINMQTNTIGKHEFYTKYVSRSLPFVLRGDAKSWEIYKEMQEFVGNPAGLDDFIALKFESPNFELEYTRLTRKDASIDF